MSTTKHLTSLIRQRAGCRDRGAIIPLTGLVLVVILTMTAFAIDLGRLRSERRDVQADADAIALSAVQAINGRNAVDAAPVVLAEAQERADRAGMDYVLTSTNVQVGRWDVPSQTFVPMTLATEFPSAVKVVLTSTIPMHFDLSADDRSVERTGIAVAQGLAQGQLGSVLGGIQQTYQPSADCETRLALEQQASFMNAIFTEFLGIQTEVQVGVVGDIGTGPCQVTGPPTGLQLDVLSWQGLGFADVSLGDVATVMGLGSPDELFDGTVNAQDFMQASATALQASPDAADVQAGTILGQIATEMDSSSQVDVGQVVGASTGDGSAAAADVNVLQLLTGTAMLVNGENLVVADLPVNLPFVDGIANTRVHVIEPPQIGSWKPVGPADMHTSQVRIAVDIPLQDVVVDFGLLGGLLQSLGVQTTTGNLSFVIEAARADATYDAIECSRTGDDHQVTMSVDTGAVTMSFGTITDTELQQAGSYTVESSSQLNGSFSILGQGINLTTVTNVEETVDYVAGVNIEGLSEADINLLGASSPHTFTGPFDPVQPYHRYPGGITGTQLTDSTYAEVSYNTALGSLLTTLGTNQASIDNLVRDALDPVIQDLGTQIVEPLMQSLGVTLAGADGRILGVQCQVPAIAGSGENQ